MIRENTKDGTWDVTCDGWQEKRTVAGSKHGCGEYEKIDLDDVNDFQGAVDNVKSKGWQVFRRNAHWQHQCPACVEAEAASGRLL